MANINERFRDPSLAKQLLERIKRAVQTLQRPINLMEVCGTHTVSISRNGIRQILPEGLKLLSGPGCPVCVTAQRDIDIIIEVVNNEQVILTTYGDMMKVPGTVANLQEAKALGRAVQVVYSPLDALKVATENPDKLVIFYSVGFETTAPMAAATLELAAAQGVRNFKIYSVHKLVPPALEGLLSADEVKIDGFILPGHVSTVVGGEAYRPVPEKYGVPAVIAGFEPLDILLGIERLVTQLVEGRATVENAYSRAGNWEGNQVAKQVLAEFFQPVDAEWRGIGVIPGSGLELADAYAAFNARNTEAIAEAEQRLVGLKSEIKGCRCGDVLKGVILPYECPLFGKACTPSRAIGPCMVSSEGSCAAYYKYERHRQLV
ncbi:MAG: hydrogenase formation protein HypD [Firmicutes bacterium]|nr:hydrogenase formation protein HypD [Bacillota bacterium]